MTAAPKTAELLLSKAFFLSHEKRAEEALDAYSAPLALEPDNKPRRRRRGQLPDHAGTPWRSAGGLRPAAGAWSATDAELYGCAAEAALLGGDPEKAAHFCERSAGAGCARPDRARHPEHRLAA